MNKNDLKSGYYLFGNKGDCWTDKVHLAQNGSSTTLCGTPMLSTNHARISEHSDAKCPECLAQYEKNKTHRPATELEQNVFAYLNGVRESGVTNMFGASPYVENEFSVSRREARDLVSLWMLNFNDECNYEIIKTEGNV